MRVKEAWSNFFNTRRNKIIFAITVLILPLSLFLFSKFLLYIEARNGVVLNDPLFSYFNAIDVNNFIFILIYSSIIGGFIHLLNYPKFLIIGLQSYILLILLRTVSMFLVPLNPPIGTIDLQDPLVFIIGTGTKITKDLFFSGHTSTLFLIFLCARNKWLKILFLILTIAVAVLIILQKVHYTIDVLVAPFYSFAVFKIVSYYYIKET